MTSFYDNNELDNY